MGILLRRFETVDERELRGKGRGLLLLSLPFALGGASLAGIPGVGRLRGKAILDESASRAGASWIPPLLAVASILPAAAVLRAAAGIFLGWGTEEDEAGSGSSGDERPTREIRGNGEPLPLTMLAPTLLLMAASFLPGLSPTLAGHAEAAGRSFTDRASYAEKVLEATPSFETPSPRAVLRPASAASFLAGALVVGSSFRRRMRKALHLPERHLLLILVRPLRAQHSGDVRDYAAWLAVGAAVLGILFSRAVV